MISFYSFILLGNWWPFQSINFMFLGLQNFPFCFFTSFLPVFLFVCLSVSLQYKVLLVCVLRDAFSHLFWVPVFHAGGFIQISGDLGCPLIFTNERAKRFIVSSMMTMMMIYVGGLGMKFIYQLLGFTPRWSDGSTSVHRGRHLPCSFYGRIYVFFLRSSAGYPEKNILVFCLFRLLTLGELDQ